MAALALSPASPQQREATIPGTDLSLRAGWLLLIRDGCRFSIPLDWKEGEPKDIFEGPHGGTLLVHRLHFDDWLAHMARIRARLVPDAVVREATADRLLMETRRDAVTEEYAEARAEDGSCAAVLRYAESAALSRTSVDGILDSLGPARGR